MQTKLKGALGTCYKEDLEKGGTRKKIILGTLYNYLKVGLSLSSVISFLPSLISFSPSISKQSFPFLRYLRFRFRFN